MNILLSGFFHENLGDDLFFHLITHRYPKHRFYVCVNAQHKHAYAGKKNVKLLPQNKLLRGMNKVLCALSVKLGLQAGLQKKTDLAVLIGGSMFQELHTDGSDLQRVSRMTCHPKGQYVLGINFGPHKTQAYLDGCRHYLSAAKDVCFRDSVSYGYFADLPNTRLGSDMVFGIESLCPAAADRENTCVISVMDFGGKAALAPYAEDYYRFLLKIAQKQIALGRKLLLVSFCQWEGDACAVEHFLDRCPDPIRSQVETLCYNGRNWQQICHRISAASCLVASRFHSMILGLVYGVPLIPISYSNKTRQVLADLGQEAFAIAPEDLSRFCDEEVPILQPMDVSRQKKDAAEHFRQLDAFLA